MTTYHWYTDSASGDINAVTAQAAYEQLIREDEWFEGAEDVGGWLRISSRDADDDVSIG